MVGDVTDKGVPAALVMAATRSVLRASAQRLDRARRSSLERVNEHLCPDMPEKMFVTCLYGVLDPATGHLRFANAGHDLPYVKTADGVEELRARGMPLGLMPGMAYEEKETVLQPGDSVLLALRRHRRGARPRPRDVRLPAPQGDAWPTAPGGGELIDRVLADLATLHRPGRRAGGRHHDGHPRALARRRARANGAVPADVLAEFELASAPGQRARGDRPRRERGRRPRHRAGAGSSA